jgi:hypothetical protein
MEIVENLPESTDGIHKIEILLYIRISNVTQMDKTAKVMEVCKDVGCINRNVTKLLIDNGLDRELAKMYTS